MADTSTIQLTGLAGDEVGFFLPGRLTPTSYQDLVDEAPFVAVKGRSGATQINQLRALGPLGVALDPAMSEPKRVLSNRVDRAGWKDLQKLLKVDSLVSPGCYLTSAMTPGDVAKLIRQEKRWLGQDRGFVSVCVDAAYLRDRTGELADVASDCELWLTLAHANDPLGAPGAVDALVELLTLHSQVSVMRCDLGALGAVAHGAARGTIGLSATVRHAPLGGGGSPSDAPSIFVPTLLAWKKADLLLSWMQLDSDVEPYLRCDERCCGGRALVRFANPAFWSAALVHNIIALRSVVEHTLTAPRGLRAQSFSAMARAAHFQHQWLAETIPSVKPSAQLRQWSAR